MVCSVCGKNEAAGVFSSRIAPVSLPYCNDCLEKCAEPYSLLVKRVAFLMTRFPDYELSPRLQIVKTFTLKITGISEEQFEKDVFKRKKEILEKTK